MTTTKAYDNLNRLSSIANVAHPAAGAYVASSHAYLYNNATQRTQATLRDGSYWTYGFDALGQVNSGKKRFSDGTWVPGEQFEYTFDELASQSPPRVSFPGRDVRVANCGGNRTATKAGGDSAGASLRSGCYTLTLLNQYTNRTVPNAVDVLGVARTDATVTVNSQSTYRKGEFFHKEFGITNSSGPVNLSITVSATSGSTVNKTGLIFVPPATEVFAHDLDGNLLSDSRWDYTWDAQNRLVRLIGKVGGVLRATFRR